MHHGQTLLFQLRLCVAISIEQYPIQGLSGTSCTYSSPAHLVRKDKMDSSGGTFPRRTDKDMKRVSTPPWLPALLPANYR